MKHLSTVLTLLLLIGLMMPEIAISQQAQSIRSTRHNTSQPLRSMTPMARAQGSVAPYAIPNKLVKFDSRKNSGDDSELGADPVRQRIMGTLAPQVVTSFDGSNDDDNAAVAGFRIVPPDTDGDVGPNHYVQWINLVSEIFDKNGNTLMGPFAGNLYFQGLGGICETTNDGDPIVLYDEEADRWLVSQFAVPGPTYSMCVAISQTADPLGAYHQYEFSFGTDFADYPKLGIWGDSYTMTTRDFANGASFAGISAVAMDRTAMLNGDPTTMVRFEDAFNIFDGAVPADFDGPGASGPAVFGAHGADGDTDFELWELDVDWNNPGAATFSSIPNVTISAYDGNVPSANQPNGQVLDDLSGFTMHRLNVRDFGTHLSMVANHSVETDPGTIGIRWYEMRNTGGNWTLHQEGTFSPDTDDRWMGSISINANGDIALGYSRSSSSLHPSIYFTGQTADMSGTGVMNVAETQIQAGGGSQSGASRWGDYSMMSVDPSDNTTFWYTTEYYAATGSFDFNTRIAAFILDDENGGGNNPPVASFTFVANDLMVDFTDGSSDSDGSVVGWDWDFGDGNTSTSQNPSHTYAASGTYSVTLTVTDDMGATGVSVQSITVNDGTTTGPALHVDTFRLTKQKQGGTNLSGKVILTVRDENGNLYEGANVIGTFSGPIDEVASDETNRRGRAVIISAATFHKSDFKDLEFCVNDVVAAGFTYDPSANGDPSWDCGAAASAGDIAAAGRDNDGLTNLQGEVPTEFAIEQNYPNPFNPTTMIAFAMPEAGNVSIKVYNLLGQEMATVVDGFQEAGRHNVSFDASRLSAGVYLYVMQSGEFSSTKRMTLLK